MCHRLSTHIAQYCNILATKYSITRKLQGNFQNRNWLGKKWFFPSQCFNHLELGFFHSQCFNLENFYFENTVLWVKKKWGTVVRIVSYSPTDLCRERCFHSWKLVRGIWPIKLLHWVYLSEKWSLIKMCGYCLWMFKILWRPSLWLINHCCNTKKRRQVYKIKLSISASWILRATKVYKEGNQKDK